MKLSSVVAPVLAVACLVAGYFACRWELDLIKLRAAELTPSEESALEARFANARKNAANLHAKLLELRAADAATAKTIAAMEPKKAQPESKMDPAAKQRAMVAFAKGWLDQSLGPAYANLARTLGLNDTQIAELRQLNAQRAVAAYTAFVEFMRGGNYQSPDDLPDLKDAVNQAAAASEGQLRQLLGDAGYQQFQTDTRLDSQLGLVQQVGQLAGSSAPLTGTQAQQLAQILAQNMPQQQQQTGPGSVLIQYLGPGPGNSSGPIPDAVVTQAAAILSPDQLAALKQFQADSQARHDVQATITQMRKELSKSQNK